MNIFIEDKELFGGINWAKFSPLVPVFEKSGDVEAICVGIRKVIDDEYVLDFKNLKYIISPSTGLDHIQVTNKDITNIHLIPSDVNHIKASSEFTLLLTLSIVRKIHIVSNSEFPIVVDDDLEGKMVGLLGYGRMANNLDRYFRAMGCEIIWHDINKEGGATKEEVLEKSEIVIVTVNCTKENTDYICYEDFLKMKKKPYFINPTRGFVVNDNDLLLALQLGLLKGAAVDGVSNFNNFREYLKNNDNIIVTPHIAGSTCESRDKACEYVLEKMKEIVDEKK